MSWSTANAIDRKTYTCGHCARLVTSVAGWADGADRIYVCPGCRKPTFFAGGTGAVPIPAAPYGGDVEHLPSDIAKLYREARDCVGVGACTAGVLTCRKLLMNLAVAQGAAQGDSFVAYVEYLADQGFVPPNGRGWVDMIRSKGNEANHEIRLMSEGDAKQLITFLEMLLKFIFEFPAKIPASSP
jgi:hypothetical protein